jgi:hypothetical protein
VGRTLAPGVIRAREFSNFEKDCGCGSQMHIGTCTLIT